MSGELHVPAGLRSEPELRVHEFRQFRVGHAELVPADDARLLGEPLPAGVAHGRTVAHALLHLHHLPGLVLPTQLDPGHRCHVLRRPAEEGRGGRGSRSHRGRSHQGQFPIFQFCFSIQFISIQSNSIQFNSIASSALLPVDITGTVEPYK